MGPEDEYSLVTFNDSAQVIVPSTQVTDVDRISRQIDRVYEGGGTNLYGGMEKGQRQILEALDSGEVGKLVILSDGKANVGVSDPDSLARFAATASSKGISVTTLGLGVDYREDVMARIADMGGGHYDFIDDPSELGAVFEAELQRTTSLVARNTAVTIDLPPEVEAIEVIGWDAEPEFTEIVETGSGSGRTNFAAVVTYSDDSFYSQAIGETATTTLRGWVDEEGTVYVSSWPPPDGLTTTEGELREWVQANRPELFDEMFGSDYAGIHFSQRSGELRMEVLDDFLASR